MENTWLVIVVDMDGDGELFEYWEDSEGRTHRARLDD
jgi:hypothetical protein